MLQSVFTIFDSAKGAHTRFFCEDSVASAMREFLDARNNPNTALHKFPEDFTLYYLGTFNLDMARFEMLGEPVPLANAKTGPKRDPEDPEFNQDLTVKVDDLPQPLLARIFNTKESK